MALTPETRNLIDGSSSVPSNGATFENVNPATEEVIGVCADGTKDDMDAAIAAARRAFDETDWARPRLPRRGACAQLHAALSAAKDELRAIVSPRRARRVLLAYAVQCDGTIDALPYWAELAESFDYETPMRDMEFMGMAEPAAPPPRGGRRRRRDHAVELPALPEPRASSGPALAAGCTIVLKPAPDTPWSRDHARPPRRREDRHPGRRRERRRVVRPLRSARCSRPIRASTSSPSPARRRPAAASWRTPPPP